MERPKTMTSLQMAFAKMTLTMNNAIMTVLIAAQGPVIRTFALNVIAKVFPITKPLYLNLINYCFKLTKVGKIEKSSF